MATTLKTYVEYVVIFSMFLVGSSIFYQSLATNYTEDLQQNSQMAKINSRLASISSTLSGSITGLGIIDLPIKLLLVSFNVIILMAFETLDMLKFILDLVTIKMGIPVWLVGGALAIVTISIIWKLLLIMTNRQEASGD